MGTRPEMALTPVVGEVQNAPDIQRTAFHCIFYRMLRW